MTITPTHEAEAFLSLLWQNIYKRVRLMMHPHHKEHEPSGLDFVRLPVGALDDVELDIDTVAIGQVLTITAVADDNALTWSNGSGGGRHAYFLVQLPGTTTPPSVPPGPKNLSTINRIITAVNFKSDGAVSGNSIGGHSFNFGAGGGESSSSGLTTAWNSGDRLIVSISSCGADGTYLVVDWLIE